MKIIYTFIVILVIFLTLAVFGGYWFKKNMGDLSLGNLARVLKGEGKIQLDDRTKAELKEKTKEVNDKIYREATKYNPEGDILPDEIDNAIKEEVKKEVKERVK